VAQAHFVVLEDRGVLAVSGPDRGSFLQGLVSNDVEKVAADRAAYAALLTAQGKYLHDFIMIAAREAIWLDGEMARLADLKRRLSIYRLRAKVEIAERPDLAVAAVFGAGACGALNLPEKAAAARPFAAGVALVDPRLAALGARVMLPCDDIRLALTGVGLAEADFAAYDRHRLALGIPDGSRDLVVEKSILLEAGFDELNGVDWQKGCYIGQELTARTKYRGLIKKRLFPVRIEGTAPARGTIVTSDGKEVGEMRSSHDRLGLALLRLDAVAQAQPMSAGVATIVPMSSDWMRIEAESPSPAPREREGPAPSSAGG
jgi:folate-binding protein YgfZ